MVARLKAEDVGTSSKKEAGAGLDEAGLVWDGRGGKKDDAVENSGFAVE